MALMPSQKPPMWLESRAIARERTTVFDLIGLEHLGQYYVAGQVVFLASPSPTMHAGRLVSLPTRL